MTNKENTPPSGLLLLDKPCGVTSFEALNPVKKALSSRKVGHTGTLDKFASGLMVVLAGRALKMAQYYTGCDKTYEAEFLFGAETDTLDPEGAVVAEAPPPERATLEAAIGAFTGDIMQTPPAYSAIHVNGKRAHELARSGQTPEMKSRPVKVSSIIMRSYEINETGKYAVARVVIDCSSGTYVRCLARDIARKAGSRAHVMALRRTRVGDFLVADAVSGDAPLEEIRAAIRIASALRPRCGK